MTTRAALLDTVWRNTPAEDRAVHGGRRYVALHPDTPLVDLSYPALRKLASVVRGDAQHRRAHNRSATVSILPFMFRVGEIVYSPSLGDHGEVTARSRNAMGWRQYAVVWLGAPGHLRKAVVDEVDLRKASAAAQGRYDGIVAAKLPEAERRARFDAAHLAADPAELAALQATPEGQRILAARRQRNREHWARIDTLGVDLNQPHCNRKRGCRCGLPHLHNQNLARPARAAARRPPSDPPGTRYRCRGCGRLLIVDPATRRSHHEAPACPAYLAAVARVGAKGPLPTPWSPGSNASV